MTEAVITAPATPAQAPTDIGAAPAAPAFSAEGTPATPATPAAPAAVSYEATGHAGLDLALSFIGGLGIGPDDPAIKAAESGDFALLKARLPTLGDKAKGWEQMLAVAERDFAGIQESAKTAAAAKEAEFATHAGSAENWSAIKTWASQKAEPAEKQAINAALAAGGIAGKAMVLYLSQIWQQASGVTVAPASAVAPNAAAAGQPGGNALSPRAYVAEVQKLRATVKGAVEDSPAYRVLQARRAAWRG